MMYIQIDLLALLRQVLPQISCPGGPDRVGSDERALIEQLLERCTDEQLSVQVDLLPLLRKGGQNAN